MTVLPLVGDVVANTVIDQNLTPNTWISLGSLSIPSVLQAAISSFSTTELTCGINAELPGQVQGCNLSQIGTILGNISTALSSSALSDLGNSVIGLGSVGAQIAAILAQIQGGNVDPEALEDLQDSLEGVSLPDFTATADSLDALAYALDAANPCLQLLGVDLGGTVAALFDSANALRNLDASFEALEAAITALTTPNQKPSAYIDALANLSTALANMFQSLKDLQTSWDALAAAMNGVTVPGIGNLGALSPIIGGLADILDVIV